MMKKKLTPKIVFEFGEQEDMPELIIELLPKTNRKAKHIIIEEHKKKNIDVSTKLF